MVTPLEISKVVNANNIPTTALSDLKLGRFRQQKFSFQRGVFPQTLQTTIRPHVIFKERLWPKLMLFVKNAVEQTELH